MHAVILYFMIFTEVPAVLICPDSKWVKNLDFLSKWEKYKDTRKTKVHKENPSNH
jgi:hypothetical protein